VALTALTKRTRWPANCELVHTPVCSPQSNGTGESFANTFKREYVNLMDRSSAEIVLAQLKRPPSTVCT